MFACTPMAIDQVRQPVEDFSAVWLVSRFPWRIAITKGFAQGGDFPWEFGRLHTIYEQSTQIDRGTTVQVVLI